MVLGVVRPLLIMWAGLNAIDDMSLLFRFSRLIMAVTPIPGLRQSQPLTELIQRQANNGPNSTWPILQTQDLFMWQIM